MSNNEEIVPYKYLPEVGKAVKDVVKEKIKLSQAEYEGKVMELAEKGLTSEKIGEQLRRQGIHPSEHNTKISQIIREKGTNRSSYIRGERKKYSWVKVGRSLVLSDILSAIALEQIKKLNTITTLRKKNATYLLKNLQTLSSKIFLPQIPKTADPNWHIFAIRVPSAIRSKVINGLRSFGIEASFHYLPLHTSAMGEKLGYRKGDLPVTEEIASTLIRLPMHPKLKKSEMDYMVEVLNKLF